MQSWNTVTLLPGVGTLYAMILMVHGRAHRYLLLLQKKDESGLALSQGHSGASLCLLRPRDNLGNPPVSVLMFLLPVAEMCFGSKEKVKKVRGGNQRGPIQLFIKTNPLSLGQGQNNSLIFLHE